VLPSTWVVLMDYLEDWYTNIKAINNTPGCHIIESKQNFVIHYIYLFIVGFSIRKSLQNQILTNEGGSTY
jgi:hypothetical protein